MRHILLTAVAVAPLWLGAQEPAPVQRPLASFVAERLAVTPVQYWRADSTGWSVAASGEVQRAALDSAIARVFRERGMGARWAFAGDVVRSARRNPTLRSDPAVLGTGRWRGMAPKPEEQLPPLVADNLRIVSALGDTRYALIPVEMRGLGSEAVLRVVIADTRLRRVVWAADLIAGTSPDAATALATQLADLVVDP